MNAERIREDRLSLLYALVGTLVTFAVPVSILTWFCCW